MIIFESKLIFVDFKEKIIFFFKFLNEFLLKNFFLLKIEKISKATPRSVLSNIWSIALRDIMFMSFPVSGFDQIWLMWGCINWRDFIPNLVVFNAILAKSLMKRLYTSNKSRQLIKPHISQIWANPDTGNGTNIISGWATDHMLDKIELSVTFLIFPAWFLK